VEHSRKKFKAKDGDGLNFTNLLAGDLASARKSAGVIKRGMDVFLRSFGMNPQLDLQRI
jgi:hypothetical protein